MKGAPSGKRVNGQGTLRGDQESCLKCLSLRLQRVALSLQLICKSDHGIMPFRGKQRVLGSLGHDAFLKKINMLIAYNGFHDDFSFVCVLYCIRVSHWSTDPFPSLSSPF